MAHRAEVRAGRALKLCQLHQGAAVLDGEKAVASLSSAPTMTDTAVQRELQSSGILLPPGCRLQAVSCSQAAPDGSSEHSCGS